jgi:hypothetical protein
MGARHLYWILIGPSFAENSNFTSWVRTITEPSLPLFLVFLLFELKVIYEQYVE